MRINITSSAGVHSDGIMSDFCNMPMRANCIEHNGATAGGRRNHIPIGFTSPGVPIVQIPTTLAYNNFFLVLNGASNSKAPHEGRIVLEPVISVFHVKYTGTVTDQLIVQRPFRAIGETLALTNEWSDFSLHPDMSLVRGMKMIPYYVSLRRLTGPGSAGIPCLDVLITSDARDIEL